MVQSENAEQPPLDGSAQASQGQGNGAKGPQPLKGGATDAQDAAPEEPGQADTGTDEVAAIEQLLTSLDNARAEAANYRDLALRAEAELQNVRRRSQREVENAHRYALERFLVNLLPVVDSMEKAMEIDRTATDSLDAVIDGVGICLKMLLDEFQKENIKQLDPYGEPFDPRFHEALTMQENSEVEANTVLNVYQKGYLLNDRLVRPAKVIVSRLPAGRGG